MITPQRRASWIASSCELDDDLYAKGTVVSNEELAAVDIVRADFRDDWNLHRQTVQSLKQSVDACRNYRCPAEAIIVATAITGAAEGRVMTRPSLRKFDFERPRRSATPNDLIWPTWEQPGTSGVATLHDNWES